MNDTLSTILAEITAAIRPQRVIEILPLAEAARALHVQPITLRRMVQSNKIGYLWDGKGYFFKVSDLNDYLEKHYTPAKPRDASGDHWENPPNI